MTKETISYAELAKRLDSMFLFNKAPELDQDFWYEGLENGTLDYCVEHENSQRDKCLEGDCEFENVEVFQWYLISSNDADYLKRNTDELVFYSNVLDEYVWGVTHFGTSWSDVFLEFGKDEEVQND